jgi:hypothetical protein
MNDPTEGIRQKMVQEINSEPGPREALETIHGRVWNTEEVSRDFEILSFAAPFVICNERSTGRKGCLMFQHHPRFYFNFTEI